ncbi:MAG: hypothetical protein R3C01_12655 [Planctomycetaceae bacterium]
MTRLIFLISFVLTAGLYFMANTRDVLDPAVGNEVALGWRNRLLWAVRRDGAILLGAGLVGLGASASRPMTQLIPSITPPRT